MRSRDVIYMCSSFPGVCSLDHHDCTTDAMIVLQLCEDADAHHRPVVPAQPLDQARAADRRGKDRPRAPKQRVRAFDTAPFAQLRAELGVDVDRRVAWV